MRLTDDRYARERHRLELALRMIRLEARTCTIRGCTGLTDDRIRKLFNTYVRPTTRGSIRRRRGKSPQQTGCFTHTLSAHLASSVLSGVLASSGLLAAALEHGLSNIELGALMCDAYEFYREISPRSSLSFEHAWFLLRALRIGDEFSLERCCECSGLYLEERGLAQPQTCPLCRLRQPRPCRSPINRVSKCRRSNRSSTEATN